VSTDDAKRRTARTKPCEAVVIVDLRQMGVA